MQRTIDVTPTVKELAEAFAEMDNHQMLLFFQHAVWTLNQIRPNCACDQFVAVVMDADIDDKTLTALACLQRDTMTKLRSYKPC
jgi:hypothetical protein